MDKIRIGIYQNQLSLYDENSSNLYQITDINIDSNTFEYLDTTFSITGFEDIDVNDELFKEEISKIKFLYFEYRELEQKAQDASNNFYCHEVSETVLNNIRQLRHKPLVSAADNIYNLTKNVYGENAKLVINYSENSFSIYILYPEITISNNIGHSRVLKDIVVRIIFHYRDNKYVVKDTIHGTRFTIGSMENSSDYVHSHLPKRKDINFSKFCLGATEIAALNMDLCLSDKYTDTKYNLFLYMIDNYLRHESLEGVPYIPLSQIKDNSNIYELNGSIIDSLKLAFFKDFNILYNDSLCKFIIKRDEVLIDEIIKHLLSKGYKNKDFMVYFNNGSEFKINYKTAVTNRRLEINSSVEPICSLFNIIPSLYDDYGDREASEQTLSNKILDIVCEKLEKEINNYYINKYANS